MYVSSLACFVVFRGCSLLCLGIETATVATLQNRRKQRNFKKIRNLRRVLNTIQVLYLIILFYLSFTVEPTTFSVFSLFMFFIQILLFIVSYFLIIRVLNRCLSENSASGILQRMRSRVGNSRQTQLTFSERRLLSIKETINTSIKGGFICFLLIFLAGIAYIIFSATNGGWRHYSPEGKVSLSLIAYELIAGGILLENVVLFRYLWVATMDIHIASRPQGQKGGKAKLKLRAGSSMTTFQSKGGQKLQTPKDNQIGANRIRYMVFSDSSVDSPRRHG